MQLQNTGKSLFMAQCPSSIALRYGYPFLARIKRIYRHIREASQQSV